MTGRSRTVALRGGAGTGRSRAGLTLVEALVACALLALLGAAVAGVLSAGLRLQADAARSAERTRLLAPYAVPGGPPVDPLPSCDAAGDGEPNVCVRARSRCRVAAGTLACDGRGGLLRVRLDVVPSPPRAAPLTVWRRAP
jgi:hypothetical protein